jgi:hypothetical protein
MALTILFNIYVKNCIRILFWLQINVLKVTKDGEI